MVRKCIITGKEFNMTNRNIQNNIRRLRFDADEMTQQELADRVSVSRQTIVAIEKGNYSPSLELAFKIALTFSTPLEDVFSYEPIEEKPKKKKNSGEIRFIFFFIVSRFPYIHVIVLSKNSSSKLNTYQ